MDELTPRVAALETRVVAIESDIYRIEDRISRTATTEDVALLRKDLRRYQTQVTSNLWRAVFGLLALLAGLVLAAFGIDYIPTM